MSTPVRGPEGPLGYAPLWARASGGGRVPAAFGATRSLAPIQELAPQLDLQPPRIARPPQGTDSTRNVPPPRDLASTRDAAPPRDFASTRDTGPPRDAALPRDSTSHRDSKPSRAAVVTQEAVQDSVTDSIWRRKKRPQIFEGDAAMRDLRARLALAPDQMPEPPLYQAKAPIFAVVARLVGVMVLAAAGALGFLWVTAPHAALPDGQVAGQTGGEMALASYRGIEVPQPAPSAQNVKTERVPEVPSSGASWKMANYTRDVTDGVGNPPAALAPRNPGPAAPRGPAARVSPPPAVAVPAPQPAAAVPPPPPAVAVPAPQPAAAVPPPPAVAVPAPQPAAAVPPPPAVAVPAARVPVPTTAVPTAPPPSTVATPDRDEVAALLTRARTYLSAGDVAAARLVLRRAAERDDAQAALALGGTYDPVVLRRLGIINFHSDPAQARDWYRKAAELGSADASLRLEQLAQTDR
jgi:hypothetical protein